MDAFGVVMAVSKQAVMKLKIMFICSRSHFLAAVMLISLLSLAGMVTLGWIYRKNFIFFTYNGEITIMTTFLSIGMSTVSVYYYLELFKYNKLFG